MSGGAFEYNQYRIRQIWEEIQNELDKQGQEKEVLFYEKGLRKFIEKTYSKFLKMELKC